MLLMQNASLAMRLGILGVFVVGCSTQGNAPVANTEPNNRTTVNRPVVPDATSTRPQLEPNNSGVNVRDRNSETKTPFDQHENVTDIKITADIRKQIGDTNMSTNAQNVKIITQEGRVTLRGPVNSEQEKLNIEKIAVAVAGANRVDSFLEVNNE